MEARKILLGFALKYANDWNRMYEAIQNKEDLTEADEANVNSFAGNFITILDSNYPKRLMQKYKPPFVLYYDGDISLLNHVDDNDGKNDLIFLHGPNTFNIPSSRLCFITDDNKVSICGGLKVWFNDENQNVDRFGLAAGLCQHIVGTKVYPLNTHSWFIFITLQNSLSLNNDIYIVPTSEPSYNNRLIKEGACLIDCYADIVSYNGKSSNLPF